MRNPVTALRNLLASEVAAAPAAGLPARVRASIARHDAASEVLVRLIQLAIIAMWGVLYAVSPKPGAGTAFSPVPYVLMAFLALNLASLLWALARPLPAAFVYLTIVLDIALLMALIWSFHIQYQQPASFYLKAPTLLYIFILIALRGLRFEPRFVVAAGLAAAAGWLAMIAYVVFFDPHDSMITRDYVAYMTGNRILLGAEFDKIISILMVTAVLALALRRAHQLLVGALAEQSAAQSLSRFFDQSVAERIRTSAGDLTAGQGVTRQAAVLNTDIRGFTRLAAAMEPSEVMSILALYQERLVQLIQECGGTIDKFLGDGIMATFGAVAPSATYAADSLRAIDAIMAEVDTWHGARALGKVAPDAVNAAVCTGEVACGVVGDSRRLEYTVIGAAVNLSAKLEKHNKVLHSRAVTLRSTWEEALAQGYRPSRTPHMARMDVGGAEGTFELAILYPITAPPTIAAPRRSRPSARRDAKPSAP